MVGDKLQDELQRGAVNGKEFLAKLHFLSGHRSALFLILSILLV